MLKKYTAAIVITLLVLLPLSAESANVFAPPIPARIGGTVTVDSVQLDQATDTGYTFEVTKDGSDYVDLNGDPAQDTDGLNASDWYLIDIPIYDATDQPEGANPGDTAVVHVYKDGSELTVTSPANGQFTVGDSGSTTQIHLVVISISNQPPTANAGPDQSVDESVTVTLDGSNSTDPDDGIASYLWTQIVGAPVTLSDTTASQPTFTSPDVGPGGQALTFQLTVTDNGGLQDTDTCIVSITWVNIPPTADAGTDQTVDEGVTVTLDGSNSSDPDNVIASYLWRQTAGTSVTLSNATAAKPTFTSPDVGAGGASLTFQLEVTDNGGLKDTDTCIVHISWVNIAPTANAGPDQSVDESVTVTLDGSNSTDPDDGIASYLWTQIVGAPVTLSNATAAKPTFTSPDVGAGGASLTFQLEVTDNGGLKDTDTCIVNVSWLNDPPVADAGADQTVDEGITVILDGSNSTDPYVDITSYSWQQVSGTAVTLSDATAVSPTFVTPPVDPGGTTLTFQLTVTNDSSLQDSDTVSIAINDNGITGFPDDVVTMECSTGESIGIKVESGGNCISLNAVDPSTIDDTTNRPDDDSLIYGLIDMQIKVDTSGATATVTFYLPTPAPDGYKWYKYGPNNGWYDYTDHAEFNIDRDQVTLTLVDGGIGDDDGNANGVIVDPSGLGTFSTTSISSSGGGGGGGCFIATAAFGSYIEPHVKILRNFRDTYLLPNRVGQSFVQIYYKYSPPLADFIAGDESRKTIVRYALYPLVGVSYVALHTTFAQQVLIMFGLVAVLSFGFMVMQRRLKR